MNRSEVVNLPYRRGVGLMILNRDSRVFVARRIDTPSAAWQMPQGGIDPGESTREAAMRELEEEIGTDKAEIIAEHKGWLKYDLPRDLVPRIWGGRYRGQMQKWFALRFLGQDSDIKIDTERPEFLEWKWVEMRELPDLIVPFKRQLYRDLVAEFGHLAEA
ncbi:MAG: RNA pyrophosphohydrolase [Alphaproteobacteria bacterium]